MSGGAQLFALPLATWERGALKAALAKVGLPCDDIETPAVMFWRFEQDDVPVGFGGLEMFGENGLLRSLVTLPPLRRRGFAREMVAVIETEALARHVRSLYLLTTDGAAFFSRLGYAPCRREEVPETVRASSQFSSLCPRGAVAMVKSL